MSNELLNCPFCGGEATMHHQGGGLGKQYWYVACHRMTCLMDLETPLMDTEAEAIEAWNTRAERTCHDFGGEEGANAEGYDFGCSACGFVCDQPEPNYCPNCGARIVEE